MSKIMFNIPAPLTQDYDRLFEMVEMGYDVPVFVFSKSANMYDVAMVRKNNNFEICISSRGGTYTNIFIDNIAKDSQKEDRRKAFIRMMSVLIYII